MNRRTSEMLEGTITDCLESVVCFCLCSCVAIRKERAEVVIFVCWLSCWLAVLAVRRRGGGTRAASATGSDCPPGGDGGAGCPVGGAGSDRHKRYLEGAGKGVASKPETACIYIYIIICIKIIKICVKKQTTCSYADFRQ